MDKIDIKKAVEQAEKNKTSTPIFDGAFILYGEDDNPFYIDKTCGGRGLLDTRIFQKVWYEGNTGVKISFVNIYNLTNDTDIIECEDDRYVDELVYKLREYYGLGNERRLDSFVSATLLKKHLKEVGIETDKLVIRKVGKRLGVKWIMCDQLPYLHKDDAQKIFNEIFKQHESLGK